MPLTARTTVRHPSRRTRNRQAAFIPAVRQQEIHTEGCACQSGRSAGSGEGQRPSVFSHGQEWRGLALPPLPAKTAKERQTAPCGGRGRCGKPPAGMGSAARSRREGKAFPAKSWVAESNRPIARKRNNLYHLLRMASPLNMDKQAKRLAKSIAFTCVRLTSIEELHSGRVAYSKTGDYSDVTVVTPFGEIPWNDLSRIS